MPTPMVWVTAALLVAAFLPPVPRVAGFVGGGAVAGAELLGDTVLLGYAEPASPGECARGMRSCLPRAVQWLRCCTSVAMRRSCCCTAAAHCQQAASASL